MSNVRTIRRGGDIFRLTEQPGGRVLVELRSVNPGVVLSGLSVPAGELRQAVDEVAPAGSYTRTESPDYADGGVTAAAIEKETEQPRPLAADDITDEMVKRAQREEERQRGEWTAPTAMRRILTAALTEPQRPAWADLADTLRAIDPAETLSIDDLAEAAHEHGVRVTEHEQS